MFEIQLYMIRIHKYLLLFIYFTRWFYTFMSYVSWFIMFHVALLWLCLLIVLYMAGPHAKQALGWWVILVKYVLIKWWGRLFETPSRPSWRHSNGKYRKCIDNVACHRAIHPTRSFYTPWCISETLSCGIRLVLLFRRLNSGLCLELSTREMLLWLVHHSAVNVVRESNGVP